MTKPRWRSAEHPDGIEWIHDEWYLTEDTVTDTTHDKGRWRFQRGAYAWPEHTTPLLPPRDGLDADGVMAAIVAGIPGATRTPADGPLREWVSIQLEAGEITVVKGDDDPDYHHLNDSTVNNTNSPAVRRDLDKRDALAAWLAGKEA